MTHADDYRFFAGWRSDPFFFDTRGAINNFQFTGEDFFAERDVCSIVLEAPNSALASKEVGLWVRTLINTGGSWVQADRGARPSQTPFLTGEQNAAYRTAEPANDAQFIPVFAHALEHTGGYKPEEARRVAGTMLPDLLRYDPTRPASFPSSDRALTDDVSDGLYFRRYKREGERNKVGPHDDLLPEFHYLRAPPMRRVDQPCLMGGREPTSEVRHGWRQKLQTSSSRIVRRGRCDDRRRWV